MAKEYPGSKGEQVFNSYKPGELFKKCVDICSRKRAPTSVIGQGDAWAPNFLIRETGSGKFDIIVIDFQLARCASPVLDLVFFMYACTDQPLRDEYYHTILKDYYTELVKSIKLFNIDPDVVYPFSVFQKEVKYNNVINQ